MPSSCAQIASLAQSRFEVQLSRHAAPRQTKGAQSRRSQSFTSHTRWAAIYERPPAGAPLVALGFSPEGARVFDALGGGALLKPHDAGSWATAV